MSSPTKSSSVPVPSAVTNTNEAQIKESDSIQEFKSFDDMSLRDEILRGVYAYGFERPSTIQAKAIIPMASDKDLIAQAQSGTGKTGAYTIGMLQRIRETKYTCQALVLVPTRELAVQVKVVIARIGAFIPGLRVHTLTGGTSVRNDIDALRHGVHVIIGTPGRVYDMISRGAFKTSDVHTFVLDEADEMLSRGFRDSIHEIFNCLPTNVKCGIYSATFPDEAFAIADKFLREPFRIVIPKDQITLKGIKQFHVDVDDHRFKLDTLCDLYESLSVSQTVIFVNSRRTAEWLHEQMRRRDFPVNLTHAQMSAEDRLNVLADFRRGSIRVLISTDLLARGIDVHGVSVVINYELPHDLANYIHRIGRSGRFGRTGVAINLVARSEYRIIHDLEDYYDTPIPPLPADVALEL